MEKGRINLELPRQAQHVIELSERQTRVLGMQAEREGRAVNDLLGATIIESIERWRSQFISERLGLSVEQWDRLDAPTREAVATQLGVPSRDVPEVSNA